MWKPPHHGKRQSLGQNMHQWEALLPAQNPAGYSQELAIPEEASWGDQLNAVPLLLSKMDNSLGVADRVIVEDWSDSAKTLSVSHLKRMRST